MGKTSTIAVEISSELSEAIAELSTLSGQSLAVIAEDALSQYVDWRTAQVRDLQEAIAAADRGEFAEDDEVDAFFARYGA